MIELAVTEVAEIVGGTLGGSTVRPVKAVEIDSRSITDGALFVALVGERVDGHDYLGQAAAAGAVAALVSTPVSDAPLPTILVPDTAQALAALATQVLARLRQRGEITVVAITGSVGKTSTKDLLSVMLAPLGEVVAPVASFNNEIGLPLTVLRANNTTATLVLEMGADAPGNLTFLTGIAPPDIAVELIVGHAHLGGFGTIDGVASAKAELVQGLRDDGIAILNADDRRVAAMADHAPRSLTFGRSASADIQARAVQLQDGHARFQLSVGGDEVEVQLALAGEHHVTNALAAASVAHVLGMALPDIAQALASAGPISPHRMQITNTENGLRVIDDSYNANPDSMLAGLRATAAMATPGRRTIAIVGEMRDLGDDSVAAHAEVGRSAVGLGIDLIVVIGSDAQPAYQAALAAGGRAHYADSVDAAQQLVAALLRPADIVFVKASNGAGLTRLGDWLTSGLELGTA
ncbi:MAG: UDP-N-acetylmuramoyl-tripeptide--D-alanyl-D-alanine ligase [Beutenbergiaceae bacterium]